MTVSNECLKQLRERRTEVNLSVGVLGFGCLDCAFPTGLFDRDGLAI
jgi:hypothetical protein